ncbi:MAG TPA: hypothetical protein PLV27_09145, partial [Anaerolineaceae bacterium]|nr:hypothetical protein [Anaerolineaceae bacterium]
PQKQGIGLLNSLSLPSLSTDHDRRIIISQESEDFKRSHQTILLVSVRDNSLKEEQLYGECIVHNMAVFAP